MVMMPRKAFGGGVKGRFFDDDSVFLHHADTTAFSKLFCHCLTAIAFLDGKALGVGKNGTVEKGGKRDQDRSEIGTVGKRQRGAACLQLFVILSVNAIALQRIIAKTAYPNGVSESGNASGKAALE